MKAGCQPITTNFFFFLPRTNCEIMNFNTTRDALPAVLLYECCGSDTVLKPHLISPFSHLPLSSLFTRRCIRTYAHRYTRSFCFICLNVLIKHQSMSFHLYGEIKFFRGRRIRFSPPFKVEHVPSVLRTHFLGLDGVAVAAVSTIFSQVQQLTCGNKRLTSHSLPEPNTEKVPGVKCGSHLFTQLKKKDPSKKLP